MFAGMNIKLVLRLLCVLYCVKSSLAFFKADMSEETCKDMKPTDTEGEAQTTESPYSIKRNQTDKYAVQAIGSKYYMYCILNVLCYNYMKI